MNGFLQDILMKKKIQVYFIYIYIYVCVCVCMSQQKLPFILRLIFSHPFSFKMLKYTGLNIDLIGQQISI
jgi:hypothetical protein